MLADLVIALMMVNDLPPLHEVLDTLQAHKMRLGEVRAAGCLVVPRLNCLLKRIGTVHPGMLCALEVPLRVQQCTSPC